MRPALLALALYSASAAGSGCPYVPGKGGAAVPAGHPPLKAFTDLQKAAPAQKTGAAAVDWKGVKADLETLMKTEQADIYPFDKTGNYNGFFIRQAWHCSGSYRVMDGRGGCEGGRQRFDPELSWQDNAQLDKAKRLLYGIKTKYGADLSWGDLIILAGNVALESQGTPLMGFCAGRVDDVDGSESLLLGPTAQQDELYHCDDPNNCTASDLGATNLGLIYVNPEGPGGVPDPVGEAWDVRVSFAHMSMNDTETVALIGGGHTFGAAHGACPLGPGPSPAQDPANPYPIPGPCGEKGLFTSGFEGSWSLQPTQWTNDYFHELLGYDWEVYVGPGGKHQWRVKDPKGNASVAALMMLTSDISLLHDKSYRAQVEYFANNFKAFDEQFAAAWYKLTTRDMGPHERCVGPYTPEPQPFQNPLPAAPKNPADAAAVLKDVHTLVRGDAEKAAALVHLAYQSASTVRVTDYLGGANGARIRFAPEAEWKVNKGLDAVLKMLEPVKGKYGASLTWADLIVVAGTAGLTELGLDARDLPFCAGRSDATDGTGSALLRANGYGEDYKGSVKLFNDKMQVAGMPKWAVVALAARPKAQSVMNAIGYTGKFGSVLSNAYYNTILTSKWTKEGTAGGAQFRAAGAGDVYATQTDVFLYYDPELRVIAESYAADEALFKQKFAEAWTLLMNADRYDGPTGNKCY